MYNSFIEQLKHDPYFLAEYELKVSARVVAEQFEVCLFIDGEPWEVWRYEGDECLRLIVEAEVADWMEESALLDSNIVPEIVFGEVAIKVPSHARPRKVVAWQTR